MITCWHSVWLLQPSSHDDLLTECPSVTAIIQWLSADRLSNCYTIIPWLSADWVSDWYAIISWLSADRVSNCYSHHSTIICWPSVKLLQPLSHDYLLTECLIVTPLSHDYLLTECLLQPSSHYNLLTECPTLTAIIPWLSADRVSDSYCHYSMIICWPSVYTLAAIVPGLSAERVSDCYTSIPWLSADRVSNC